LPSHSALRYSAIKNANQEKKMKPIANLDLGFSDAENYQKREHKQLFNSIL